jgi:methionyl-tRNA formyltransferase
MNKKFRWIFAGSKDQGFRILKRLLEDGFFPDYIILPRETTFREKKKFFRLAKIYRLNNYVSVSDKIPSKLASRVDILCTCRFPVVKKRTLLTFKMGGFNIHSSLLPLYRGVHPVSWALINGEETVGVSIHHLTESVDAGPILLRGKLRISAADDIKSLTARLNKLSAKLTSKFFRKFNIRRKLQSGIPQPEGTYFYARRRTPEDSWFEWRSKNPDQIRNLIRALQPPYPLAACQSTSGTILTIKAAVITDKSCSGTEDGTILSRQDDWYEVASKNIVIRIQVASLGPIGLNLI